MSLTYFHKADYELTNHMLQVLDYLELLLEGGRHRSPPDMCPQQPV
jgi:hypothetical protein